MLKKTYIETYLFVALLIILSYNIIFNKPIIAGDSYEYLIMTSAWANHFSPNINKKDIEQAYSSLKEIKNPNDYHKSLKDNYINFLSTGKTINNSYGGLYKTNNNHHYFYHFWFYSLLCAPLYLILEKLELQEIYSFSITNSLFIIIALIYVLFYSKIDLFKKFLLSSIFLFSANIWYINWIHPEILTSTLLFLSILLIYEKIYILSLILSIIASLHNPSIMFILPFIIILDYLYYKDIRNVIFMLLISIVCFIPFLFYKYHYGTYSLISSSGFVSLRNINIHRLSSLFFDINQGIIISMPVILILFILTSFRNIIRIKEKSFLSVSLPIAIIIIALPVLSQTNWNMGESVIIRYGVWLSMPILIYTVMENSWTKIFMKIFSIIVLTLQITVCLYFGGFTPEDWKYLSFNNISKKIMDNYPYLYNPDEEIFRERLIGKEDINTKDSTYIYINKNNRITKILTTSSKKDLLIKNNNYKNFICFKNNNRWIYINFF